MINLFKKGPESVEELAPQDNIYAALQNTQQTPQDHKIDLTSGNELSMEGKMFCNQLNTQKMPQELNMPPTTGKVDQPPEVEFKKTADLSAMLADLQKMRLEEAALLGVKQHLSVTQQELENKIIKEMERTKQNIYGLSSEIDVLEKNCKKLSEVFTAPDLTVERTVHLSLTV
jgi:hypothetical protein